MAIVREHSAHLARSSEGLFAGERVLREAGLKAGDAFLDAGAGPGYLSLVAAGIVGDSGRVYALDIRPEAVATVQQEAHRRSICNIQTMIADLSQEIPLGDNIIDFCLLSNVLHDLVEDGVADGALGEIARVLKPEGRLLVIEFKADSEPPPGPPRQARMSLAQVAALVGQHGFAAGPLISAGPYNDAILCFRRRERA